MKNWMKRLTVAAIVLGLAAPVFADEGLWLFNAFPGKAWTASAIRSNSPRYRSSMRALPSQIPSFFAYQDGGS